MTCINQSFYYDLYGDSYPGLTLLFPLMPFKDLCGGFDHPLLGGLVVIWVGVGFMVGVGFTNCLSI